MFDALRRFVGDLAAPDRPSSPLGEEEIRLAVAALLYHVVAVDGLVTDEERARLRSVLTDRYQLDDDEVDALMARGESADREAVDLYRFTSVLKARLDESERRQVVSLLWDMVYADGRVDEFEDNVLWRVSELLGIPARDRIGLKQRAARRPS